MKRFIVTESERKTILKKYGLLLEQDESNTEMSSIVQQNVYDRYDTFMEAKKKYESDLVKYNSLIKDYQSKVERYKDQMAVYDLIEKVGTGEVSLFDMSTGFPRMNFSSANNFDIARLKKIKNEYKIPDLSGECDIVGYKDYFTVRAFTNEFITSITPIWWTYVRNGIITSSQNLRKKSKTYNDTPTLQDRIGLIPDGTNYDFDVYLYLYIKECFDYSNYEITHYETKLMKFKTPIPPSEPIKPIEPILKIDKNVKRAPSQCGITLVGKKDEPGFDYIEDTKTGEKLGDYDKSKSTDWNIRQFCKQ